MGGDRPGCRAVASCCALQGTHLAGVQTCGAESALAALEIDLGETPNDHQDMRRTNGAAGTTACALFDKSLFGQRPRRSLRFAATFEVTPQELSATEHF